MVKVVTSKIQRSAAVYFISYHLVSQDLFLTVRNA
jgi:hypothetical protein